MPIEADFLEMMPHTITVTPVTGVNRRNEPSLGTPQDYRGRVVGKILSLRRSTMEDQSTIFDIYLGFRLDDGEPVPLDATDVITSESKVELPSDLSWVDHTPVIFAVARSTDEHGHHHVKLQCGWMYHRQGQ